MDFPVEAEAAPETAIPIITPSPRCRHPDPFLRGRVADFSTDTRQGKPDPPVSRPTAPANGPEFGQFDIPHCMQAVHGKTARSTPGQEPCLRCRPHPMDLFRPARAVDTRFPANCWQSPDSVHPNSAVFGILSKSGVFAADTKCDGFTGHPWVGPFCIEPAMSLWPASFQEPTAR